MITEPILLESTSSNVNEYFVKKLSNGKVVQIHNADYDFFKKLKNLPTSLLLEIFEISAMDIQKVLNESFEPIKTKCSDFLFAEWKDRECGYQYLFDDKDLNHELFGIRLSFKQLKGKFKRGTLILEEMNLINNYFENQDEFYSEKLN